MRRVAIVFWSLLLAALPATSADDAKPDPWAPVRFLIGRWEGTTQGEPGSGAVVRTYEFVLGSRFVHERNVSTYPPQEKNKSGEVHEHWRTFSARTSSRRRFSWPNPVRSSRRTARTISAHCGAGEVAGRCAQQARVYASLAHVTAHSHQRLRPHHAHPARGCAGQRRRAAAFVEPALR